MRRKLLVTLLMVGVSLVAQLQAQPQSPTNAKETTAPAERPPSWTSPPPLKLATVVGERLDYLVSWAEYLVAARVLLEVKEPTAASEREGLPLQMQVQTVGVVRSLFIAIDDEFTSYVDPLSTLPFRFEKHLRRGNRRVDSIILFNHKEHTARMDDAKSVPIDPETRDVVALFYHLRTLDWGSGKQYKLVGIYEHKPFTILVRPEQRGMVETPTGPVDAIEVALRAEEGKGRRKKISDDYRLRIWLSNDEKRIPVLITARPTFGEIQVRLTKPEP